VAAVKGGEAVVSVPLAKFWRSLLAWPGGPSSPARLQTGKIFLLDGIGGARLLPRCWAAGLRAAGLEHDLEEFYWSNGVWAAPVFADAWTLNRNRRQAEHLAERIRVYRCLHPDRPLHLLAHSGGTAIAVFALELLAPEESVTSAVLANSGLSPGYDLTPALARTTAGMLALHSPLDLFFLGLGGLLVGSMDRRRGVAAGLVGFRPPSAAPEVVRAYERLRQLWWRPGLVRRGWLGTHVSAASGRFARGMLAPWVREVEEKGRYAAKEIPRSN
jgi:hypothetical protein